MAAVQSETHLTEHAHASIFLAQNTRKPDGQKAHIAMSHQELQRMLSDALDDFDAPMPV